MLDNSRLADFLTRHGTERCDIRYCHPPLGCFASRSADAPKQDLWELYHDRLEFLTAVDPTEIWVRTSTEDRTLQVAGAMLAAMDPRASGKPWKVHTQPASVCNTVAVEPNTHIITTTDADARKIY